MKTECTIVALDKMPWEKRHIIRLIIPGIDGGAAVYLETECKGDMKTVEAMTTRIAVELNKGVRHVAMKPVTV